MRPGQHKRLSNPVIGLILVVVIAVGSFLAYNKKLPWSHGYEVKAVFTTAENIRVKSPVRIAGVNVGIVTDVHHCTADDSECGGQGDSRLQAAAGGQTGTGGTPQTAQPAAASVVTMQITDEGRPIFEDATFKLRPRLFLEGNLFVDLHPGTPGAPEAPANHTFPSTQTSVAVQLDQVLTTLQSDVRRNLQIFLQEFGDALIKYHGAEGFRELYKTSPAAFKYTSIVNQAFLGTQPHDLSGLIKNLDSTVQALDADQTGLQNLIANLRIVTGSFAAQSRALQVAIGELPRVLDAGRPALLHLSQSFPPLRAFAREILPGVRSTPETLDAATPLLNQIRGLVSRPELRGLVHDLRPTIPRLTKLTKRTIPFLHQSRALSSCFNEVIIPWSNDTVPDPNNSVSPSLGLSSAGKVYEETGYGLAGIGGESRSGDANGQDIRVEAGGGTNTVVLPAGTYGVSDQLVGITPFPLLGGMPSIPSSAKTPFRPDAPCERQQPPNLNAGNAANPPQQMSAPASSAAAPFKTSGVPADFVNQSKQILKLRADGKDAQANALAAQAARGYIAQGQGTKALQSMLKGLKATASIKGAGK